MRKSSRLWWLHGAILLSAVVGCKSNNSGGALPPGPPPMSTAGPSYMGAPSGGGTSNTFPAGSPSTPYSSTSGSQTFAPSMGASASPMYSQPGMATSGGPSFGH